MRPQISAPSRALSTTTKGPVSIRIVQAGPDQVLLEMKVDYRNAETPGRAYFADYCDVQKGRLSYNLVFGKLDGVRSNLRTKIEVAFPREMFLRQLWASSRELHQTVDQIVARTISVPMTEPVDTDKVQTFRSNNVFMGVWGEESVLDFYYMSPKDVHELRSRQRSDVTLEPVVRVVMDTGLLYEFLEKCRPFAEAQPEEPAMAGKESA